MESFKYALAKFFGVAIRGKTYLNLVYLLLAFPLGLAYFIFLVVGITTGVPLVIVWVGLFILAAVFAIWYALVAFERQMAIKLLGEDIPPMNQKDTTGMSLWQKLVVAVKNPVTWKGLVYLFAKFPLGLVSFIVLVTLISLSASLIGAPFYYQYVHPQVNFTVNNALWNPVWIIDTLPEALLASAVGLLIGLVSLHVFNGLAWISGKFARLMLGNFSTPAAPAAPSLPETPATAV